jgi:hypothetical protein
VTVCRPKLKLSIFTSAFAAAGWSAAVMLGDPPNSSSAAIITGATTPAGHTFLLVIFLFPFQVLIVLLDLHLFGPVCLDRILGGLPKGESPAAGAGAIP